MWVCTYANDNFYHFAELLRTTHTVVMTGIKRYGDFSKAPNMRVVCNKCATGVQQNLSKLRDVFQIYWETSLFLLSRFC